MRRRHHEEIFWYGNFRNQEPDSLIQGWETYDARPRFGTNSFGMRGKLAILSEGYSNDPFGQRITATYDFLHEILSLAAEQRDRVKADRGHRGGMAPRFGDRPLDLRPAGGAGGHRGADQAGQRRVERLLPPPADRGLPDDPDADLALVHVGAYRGVAGGLPGAARARRPGGPAASPGGRGPAARRGLAGRRREFPGGQRERRALRLRGPPRGHGPGPLGKPRPGRRRQVGSTCPRASGRGSSRPTSSSLPRRMASWPGTSWTATCGVAPCTRSSASGRRSTCR